MKTTSYLTEENADEKQLNREIRSNLKATLKKREIQISNSMDEEFESSKMAMIEILSVYLEKDDYFTNKIASDFKDKMDEYAEERSNCLRKLLFGFEKYQLTASTLLESLEKTQSNNLSVRGDLEKDLERMRSIHQREMNQLRENIEKLTEPFHKTGNSKKIIRQ
ncbi:8549_t:CDS:2 [Funneliformis caledonium]|uniref:8549_t:CDS:1 n=1 Tax=Funneliformis caledonium TaxID=1117310 RepID=A0A9N8V5T0_9GLOM|nr:8549_t:CDS:2 [Funneliformis caledonium]